MWQAIVLNKVNKITKPFEGVLALIAKVYYQSFRRDVDTILFCDLLQKYGIVKNDRQIRMKVIDGIDIDERDPRVEFGLYRLDYIGAERASSKHGDGESSAFENNHPFDDGLA